MKEKCGNSPPKWRKERDRGRTTTNPWVPAQSFSFKYSRIGGGQDFFKKKMPFLEGDMLHLFAQEREKK